MTFQRVNKSSLWNSPREKETSLFAPRPFLLQTKENTDVPLTNEDRENQAYEQHKFEVTGLQVKEEYGTITPTEQEHLGVLQAKMKDFWVHRREKSPGFNYNFANVKVHDPDQLPRIEPRLTIEKPGVRLEQKQGLVQRQEMLDDEDKQISPKLESATLQREEILKEEEDKISPKLQVVEYTPPKNVIQRVTKRKAGGVRVDVADNQTEAESLCKKEASTHNFEEWNDTNEEMEERSFDWDTDLTQNAKSHILEIAQQAKYEEEAAGLPMAYKLIYTEYNEKQKIEKRKERNHQINDDYQAITAQVHGNAILTAAVDWMRDDYISGASGNVNHTLGPEFTRAEVTAAVNLWGSLNHWLPAQLDHVRNLHGYPVGPKNPQVGDTLDNRGDQGNIIAKWGGAKINIHINPSD